jgi:hypothetical protein
MKTSPAPRGRNLSDAEMCDRLVSSSHRLYRHQTQFLADDIGAGDDLAANLRTLICRGKGDDVLSRAAKRFGIQLPAVTISAPANGEPSTMLSVGSLPIAEDYGAMPRGGVSRVTFDEWRDSPCLVVERSSPAATRVFTWEKFIATAANTWGSHTATTIPPVLDETRMSDFGDRPVDSLLLSRAGHYAETILLSLLTELGLSEDAPPPRAADTAPISLAWLRVHDTGPQAEILVIPGVRNGVKAGEYPLLEVPLRDEARMVVTVRVASDGSIEPLWDSVAPAERPGKTAMRSKR